MRRALIPAVVIFLAAVPLRGDYITSVYGTATPDDAWAYYRAVGVGRGNSSTYVPVRADYTGKEIFEGFVFYPGGGPSNPAAGWIHREPSLYNEDTIRVFRTYVLSATDMSVPIVLGTDDGHSIYVDGVFMGGGGFGVPVEPTINLKAGGVTEIELLGYNGPGPWQLVFRRQDGTEFADTAGLQISATGSFQAVPEPSSFVMLLMGGVAGYLFRCRRIRVR